MTATERFNDQPTTYDVMFRDRATGDLRKIVPDVPERQAHAMVAAHSSETLAVNLRRHRSLSIYASGTF